MYDRLDKWADELKDQVPGHHHGIWLSDELWDRLKRLPRHGLTLRETVRKALCEYLDRETVDV